MTAFNKQRKRQMTEIENRFTYHAPKNDQSERYILIRDTALAFACLIDAQCPDSREKSLAITHLEETVKTDRHIRWKQNIRTGS